MTELSAEIMEQYKGGGLFDFFDDFPWLCYGAALVGTVGIVGATLATFGAGTIVSIYAMSAGLTTACAATSP